MAAKSFTVAVTTPGTIQNLASLVGSKLPQISGVLSGPAELRGTVINFQADPTNTAAKNIYVGGPDLNVASRVGIGLCLAPGAIAQGIYLDGTTTLADFWIDVDTAATTKNLFVIVVG